MNTFLLTAFLLATPPGPVDLTDVVDEALGRAPPAAELYAVRVARSPNARRNLFIKDETLPKRLEIAFAFCVIRDAQRILLIDVGFQSQKVDGWRIESYRNPIASLKELEIEPTDVTDVVLTHSHWDHIGGLSRFDRARLWMTEPTLNALRRRAAKGNSRLSVLLDNAERQARLQLVAGPERITSYLTAVPVGLHTRGFQYLVMERADGPWVIASDIGPLRATFERLQPTGQTSDPKSTTETIHAIMKVVGGDIRRIVPGHEPTLFVDGPIVELKTNPKGAE